MYKSPLLERVKIKDIPLRESQDNAMYLAMKDLAEQAAINDSIDPFDTEYYRKWVDRKAGRWSGKKIKQFVKGKYDMMMDIKNNGMKDPLIINTDGKLSDGGHRLVILEALGYESAIVRKLC
jgi:hypothetical protein